MGKLRCETDLLSNPRERAGKIAPWVKTLDTKPDSLNSGSYIVREENRLQIVALWLHFGGHMQTHTSML